MDFLVLGNLTVAVILAISGVAKLRAPAETRDAFVALRLPRWLQGSPVPALLPWGELLLAGLLVFGAGWVLTVAAVASVLLFLAYGIVIARALGFDEPVRCSCFGALGAGDVSRRTLIRNVLLLGTAVFGLVGALIGVSVYGQPAPSVGWIAMAALAAAVATLSLGTGEPAAAPTGKNPFAREMVVTEVGTGKRVQLGSIASRHEGVVLLFVMAGCGACERVLNELPGLLAENPERVVVPVRPSHHGLDDPKWEQLADLHEDWASNVTRALVGPFLPAAVELDARGNIVAAASNHPERVLALIRGAGDVVEEAPKPEPAPVTEAVAPEPVVEPEPEEDDGLEDYEREAIPEAVVLDADKEPVLLRQLARQQAQLLVTVDCRCSPARRAMEAVDDWRRRLPVLETRLMPSFKLGEGEVTEAVAERAVYDHGGLAAKALGATGQVAAVLLGADGLLAGGPVHGFDEVEAFVADIEAQIPAST